MTNPSPNTDRLAEVVEAAAPQIQEDLDLIRDVALDFESAALAIAELEGRQEKTMDGSTVYSGRHPKHGNIHIIMPAAGDGLMLLPFVIRDF